MAMAIHKLITKPPIPKVPPKAILWLPANVEYPPKKMNDNMWQVYVQEEIVIPRQSVKIVALKFGVKLTLGVVLISLKQQLKSLRCSIQNESVVEDTQDIIITLQNNSSNDLTIRAGESICYIIYVV
jgi:hypothetical protein